MKNPFKRTTQYTEEDMRDDTRLAALFSSIRKTDIPVPSREEFRALLSRIPTKNITSPYAPIISTFMTLRFVTPLALGFLIVVSGIGIETGRISLDKTVPPYTLSKELEKTADVFAKESIDAMPAAAQKTFTEEELTQEENYDTYFASEDDTFTSLADAYDTNL